MRSPRASGKATKPCSIAKACAPSRSRPTTANANNSRGGRSGADAVIAAEVKPGSGSTLGPMASRRRFLSSLLATGAGLGLRAPRAACVPPPFAPRESSLLAALRAGDPATLAALAPATPSLLPAQAAPALAQRFSDLRRHFVFEYYPWYRADPWFHWDQWERRPPDDIAAN